jgi:hypothetical protein
MSFAIFSYETINYSNLKHKYIVLITFFEIIRLNSLNQLINGKIVNNTNSDINQINDT